MATLTRRHLAKMVFGTSAAVALTSSKFGLAAADSPVTWNTWDPTQYNVLQNVLNPLALQIIQAGMPLMNSHNLSDAAHLNSFTQSLRSFIYWMRTMGFDNFTDSVLTAPDVPPFSASEIAQVLAILQQYGYTGDPGVVTQMMQNGVANRSNTLATVQTEGYSELYDAAASIFNQLAFDATNGLPPSTPTPDSVSAVQGLSSAGKGTPLGGVTASPDYLCNPADPECRPRTTLPPPSSPIAPILTFVPSPTSVELFATHVRKLDKTKFCLYLNQINDYTQLIGGIMALPARYRMVAAAAALPGEGLSATLLVVSGIIFVVNRTVCLGI